MIVMTRQRIGLSAFLLVVGSTLAVGCGSVNTTQVDAGASDDAAAAVDAAALDAAPGCVSNLLYEDGGDLILVNSSGQAPSNLTNSVARQFRAAFSPDGSLISYSNDALSSEFDVFVANADGSNPREVSIDANDRIGGRAVWVSPTRLVFGSDLLGNGAGADVIVANDDGSERQSIAIRSIVFGAIAASASTQRLAYNLSDNQSSLRALNADGTDAAVLSGTGGFSPEFSPDGTRIAFVRGGDVLLVNPDGTGEVNLTSNLVAPATRPAWSADGTQLFFLTRVGNNNGRDVFVMNTDGSGQAAVTTSGGAADILDLAVSPDGERIAFSEEGGALRIRELNGGAEVVVPGVAGPAAPLWQPCQ